MKRRAMLQLMCFDIVKSLGVLWVIMALFGLIWGGLANTDLKQNPVFMLATGFLGPSIGMVWLIDVIQWTMLALSVGVTRHQFVKLLIVMANIIGVATSMSISACLRLAERMNNGNISFQNQIVRVLVETVTNALWISASLLLIAILASGLLRVKGQAVIFLGLGSGMIIGLMGFGLAGLIGPMDWLKLPWFGVILGLLIVINGFSYLVKKCWHRLDFASR